MRRPLAAADLVASYMGESVYAGGYAIGGYQIIYKCAFESDSDPAALQGCCARHLVYALILYLLQHALPAGADNGARLLQRTVREYDSVRNQAIACTKNHEQ